jgi:hypothetical protein
MHALPVPPAALRDEKTVHMLGSWIAEEGLHCSLNVGFFQANGHDEPRAWGIMLADVVRHLADALSKDQGMERQASIEAMLSALQDELAEPTSDTDGDFVAKPN